jgi:hypothetical protein
MGMLPSICENSAPCKTAAKLKEANNNLKSTISLLDATKRDVENLRDILYVEPTDTDDLLRQLFSAQELISKMAENLGIDSE